jgi:TrpR family trp operon transcriptional repressor
LSLSDISTVLCHIDVFQQMQDFLGEILTPSEQRDLALRWELMRRLKKGVPQRQIAKELGISLCKITRGAKILKQDHSVSKHYLNAGETDESENLS